MLPHNQGVVWLLCLCPRSCKLQSTVAPAVHALLALQLQLHTLALY